MSQQQIKKDLYKRNLVKKYELKRLALKSLIYNQKIHPVIVRNIQLALDKFPRNSAAVRVKNFCPITGRSKGVSRFFKMSRIKFKELSLSGKLPGIRKASW